MLPLPSILWTVLKKPQFITLGIAALGLVLLLAFGRTVPGKSDKISAAPMAENHEHTEGAENAFSIDKALIAAKKGLTEEQVLHLDLLEKSITRGDVKAQQIGVYHQLAHFWRDTARAFVPFAWYTAESARLENSEKSLTFAAQLFLNQLTQVENDQMRHWMAEEAKDLFEKALVMNAANDSAKVGLGAAYLYGGLGTPMEGIGKIREVVERDSTNIYAQMTLVTASLMSGQKEKAYERLETIVKIQPKNIQALLMLGDLHEKDGNKSQALQWYSRAVQLAPQGELKAELEKRIADLKK